MPSWSVTSVCGALDLHLPNGTRLAVSRDRPAHGRGGVWTIQSNIFPETLLPSPYTNAMASQWSVPGRGSG